MVKIEDIKTIDINVKEWFDKINGNSYFSGYVVLNYCLEDEVILKLPFQYGYDDHYKEMGFKAILEFFNFPLDYKYARIESFCKERNIILRTNKEKNCLKRDLEL